jgi:hypothetical protein
MTNNPLAWSSHAVSMCKTNAEGKMIIDSRQFRLVISMTDLFQWADDDTPSLLDTWTQMIQLLDLDETQIAALYHLYFDSTSIGQGNVYVFINDAQPENRLVFDLYRGLTDQLDIIEIMVSISRALVIPTKSLLRHAFDLASHQIHYEEGNYLKAFKEAIDVESYPKMIEESGYCQQLLITRFGE